MSHAARRRAAAASRRRTPHKVPRCSGTAWLAAVPRSLRPEDAAQCRTSLPPRTSIVGGPQEPGWLHFSLRAPPGRGPRMPCGQCPAGRPGRLGPARSGPPAAGPLRVFALHRCRQLARENAPISCAATCLIQRFRFHAPGRRPTGGATSNARRLAARSCACGSARTSISQLRVWRRCARSWPPPGG